MKITAEVEAGMMKEFLPKLEAGWMKIIAEVEAGIMNDEWCFCKPTFSGLYSIYSVAPKRPAPKRSAPKRPCAKTGRCQNAGAKPVAPNRRRQNVTYRQSTCREASIERGAVVKPV